VLGIILGISILITVISVMNGFEKELKNKVLGFTSHVTAYTNNLDRPDFYIFDELMQKRRNFRAIPHILKKKFYYPQSIQQQTRLLQLLILF
jgi:ABC-type transport system, involved in lipoprotein release, permease component